MAKVMEGRKVVMVEMPAELVARADAAAGRELLNRSSWLRRLVDSALTRCSAVTYTANNAIAVTKEKANIFSLLTCSTPSEGTSLAEFMPLPKRSANVAGRPLTTFRTPPAQLTNQGDKLDVQLRMRFATFTLAVFPTLAFAGATEFRHRHGLIELGDRAEHLAHKLGRWRIVDEGARIICRDEVYTSFAKLGVPDFLNHHERSGWPSQR